MSTRRVTGLLAKAMQKLHYYRNHTCLVRSASSFHTAHQRAINAPLQQVLMPPLLNAYYTELRLKVFVSRVDLLHSLKRCRHSSIRLSRAGHLM